MLQYLSGSREVIIFDNQRAGLSSEPSPPPSFPALLPIPLPLLSAPPAACMLEPASHLHLLACAGWYCPFRAPFLPLFHVVPRLAGQNGPVQTTAPTLPLPSPGWRPPQLR